MALRLFIKVTIVPISLIVNVTLQLKFITFTKSSFTSFY